MFLYIYNIIGDDMEFTVEDYNNAHAFCNDNKELLEQSKTCGCFYCLTIFSPKEIIDYTDEFQNTATCPHCGIDSVLPDNVGYPITGEFLKQMKKHWF